MRFNITEEKAQLEAGTHFWCKACIAARPVEELSTDPRYCKSCFEVIQAEKNIDIEQKQNKDKWAPDGKVFIHFGQGYTVTPGLEIICLGPVDADGNPQDTAGAPLTTIKIGRSPVTTLPQVLNDVSIDVTALVTAKIKHLAGRGMSSRAIQKELAREGVNISHMTIARRLQGVLI